MPQPGRVTINDFQGTALDVHRARLPDGKFQVDEGGDHFEQGSWKVRRGMAHTDEPKRSAAIDTILGFSLSGPDFALLYTEGTNAHGALNTGTQDDGSASGLGAGGLGTGGLGA